MILISDSQELGQVVLPSTLILGWTHFSSLTGSSLDQMEVLRCHSNTCVGCLLSSCCILLSVLTLGWPVLYQLVAVQPSSVLTGGNNHTWNLHSTLSQRRSGTFAGSILLIFHPSCRINRTQLLLSTRKWELKEIKWLTSSYKYAAGSEWSHRYPWFNC